MFNNTMGREEHCKQYHWRVLGVLPVYGQHWACPSSCCMCFPGLNCSGSRVLCRALSKAGPAFCALPRSKPLRFRFSGTPQRHRFSWACVLRPFQVQAAQATRCSATTLSPDGAVCLIASPVPAAWIPGCTAGVLSQVCCVSPLGS